MRAGRRRRCLGSGLPSPRRRGDDTTAGLRAALPVRAAVAVSLSPGVARLVEPVRRRESPQPPSACGGDGGGGDGGGGGGGGGDGGGGGGGCSSRRAAFPAPLASALPPAPSNLRRLTQRPRLRGEHGRQEEPDQAEAAAEARLG